MIITNPTQERTILLAAKNRQTNAVCCKLPRKRRLEQIRDEQKFHGHLKKESSMMTTALT